MSDKESIQELKKVQELLQAESSYEKQELESALHEMSLSQRVAEGLSLYPLSLQDESYTTAGKLKLVFLAKQEVLGKNSFQVGSMVSLFRNDDKQSSSEEQRLYGTVAFVRAAKVEVLFAEEECPAWLEDGKLGLDFYYNEHSYKEMQFSLERVIKAKSNRLAELREIVLGYQKPSFRQQKVEVSNEELNKFQKQGIQNILQAEDVAAIHGPPGTGKTRTLIKSLNYILQEEEKVLLTASSNAAVDLLLEKALAEGFSVVRIGNPVRISDALQKYSLESQITSHPDYALVKRYKSEATIARKQALKFKRKFGKEERDNRRALLQESHDLFKQAKILEANLEKEILQRSDVVCATLVGISSFATRDMFFSTVLIDEAAQCLQAATWIAIARAGRVVFAGDHQQLPPVVKSPEAQKGGMSVTLFEKVIAHLQEGKQLLKIQYRMNQNIMEFSNRFFYESQLSSAEANAGISLQDFHATPQEELQRAVVYIDTAGYDANEERLEKSTSIFNRGEVDLLIKVLQPYKDMLQDSSEHASLAIISPYREQIRLLTEQNYRESLAAHFSAIEVDTIDAFQGREKDVIVLSLVRSNDDGEIGFLQDVRRMNVAMTRAKRLLVVIGDSATIGEHPFYSDFLEYCNEIGAYRSAWEYAD
ncbi:MAG: AAA domain-containing protein [Spirochaetota bacterium]